MLVEAYSTATGKKRMIPEHYLTSVNFAGMFSKTPKQKAADKLNGPPTSAWTIAELTAYAGDHGIDLDGAKLHADIFEAINTHQPPTGPGPGNTADADNTEE